MLDAEKLKELQAKNIICEQEFVEQKHNLFNRIMRHENNPKAKMVLFTFFWRGLWGLSDCIIFMRDIIGGEPCSCF